MSEESEPYECIIVGAGISGIGCAHALVTAHNIDPEKILILEAADYVGGRIKTSLEVVTDFPIELGAEVIHGQGNALAKVIADLEIETRRFFCTAQGDGGPDFEPVDGKFGSYCVKDKYDDILWYDYDTSFNAFVRAHDLIHGIVEVPEVQRNITILEYLKAHRVSEDMISLFEAGYANAACSKLSELALSKMAEWSEFWIDTSGDDDFDSLFVPPFSYSYLISHFTEEAGLSNRILLNTEVSNVEIIGDMVRVKTSNDNHYLTKCCVISVSPSVLKRGLIKFKPDLPEEKVEALKSVAFNPAMKVFILFKKRVWPKCIESFVCGGEFEVPEIWFKQINEELYLATGLITAAAAEKQMSRTDDEIVHSVVHQLEEMAESWDFGKSTANKTFDAPEAFLKGHVQRWDESSTPFIGGGYHSPKFSEKYDPDYNKKLAQNVDSKIFFCGEATNENEGCTAPSAYDSGVRAAREINSVNS